MGQGLKMRRSQFTNANSNAMKSECTMLQTKIDAKYGRKRSATEQNHTHKLQDRKQCNK